MWNKLREREEFLLGLAELIDPRRVLCDAKHKTPTHESTSIVSTIFDDDSLAQPCMGSKHMLVESWNRAIPCFKSWF